jgi:glutamate/aspartate transport system permease protein
MKYNWNWSVLFSEPYTGWLISGLGWTVAVALSAWIIAFSLGSIVGILRTSNLNFLRKVAIIYIEIFRNIPLLVQMFLWYFVVPEFLPTNISEWVKHGMPLPEFWSAVICLGCYTASRVAEQVRAGIQSIPKGQTNAALAIGLRPLQVYRYVLIPMSYRLIVPPLTSEFLTIFKNSSIALTIGLLELTAQSRQIESYTFQGFEAFTAATVLYILITMIVIVIMRWVEKRIRIPGLIGR